MGRWFNQSPVQSDSSAAEMAYTNREKQARSMELPSNGIDSQASTHVHSNDPNVDTNDAQAQPSACSFQEITVPGCFVAGNNSQPTLEETKINFIKDEEEWL